MIDIYDEVGYIKEILENGLSYKWERDALLLCKYYKISGVKKSDCKNILKQKCEMYVPTYNQYVHYKLVNKIVENAYRNEVKLREIRYIDISKEVLEWFLGLTENYILTDEQLQEERDKRKSLKISKNPFTFQRVKFLFTLYIWTKIQENYLEKPEMHYLQKYNSRFKHDANLSTSFSIQKEKDLLYDLGFIGVNYAQGIKVLFIDNYPDIFKIEITDKNRIRLSGEDLYNCGYWLQKQKMGSFICQRCGKEIAHYSKSFKERSRKYCKDCAESLKNNVTENEQKICCDCGKPFVVTKRNYKSLRCSLCQEKMDRFNLRNRVRKFRKEVM